MMTAMLAMTCGTNASILTVALLQGLSVGDIRCREAGSPALVLDQGAVVPEAGQQFPGPGDLVLASGAGTLTVWRLTTDGERQRINLDRVDLVAGARSSSRHHHSHHVLHELQ